MICKKKKRKEKKNIGPLRLFPNLKKIVKNQQNLRFCKINKPRLRVLFPPRQKKKVSTHKDPNPKTEKKDKNKQTKEKKIGICCKVTRSGWNSRPQGEETKPELRGRIETIW